MTPALPALDALLKEVEARAARGGDILSVLGYTQGVRAQTCEQRLAAMLRVAVEALYGGANLVNGRAECRAALARIEQIAAGDQGEA